MQECGSLQPDVDERRLHAGKNPRHAALVDIADQAALRGPFNVDLLQHAVLEQRGPHLARRHVDKNFFF